MTNRLDLSGKKFARLKVLKTYVEEHRSWSDCRCDCGEKLKVLSHSLMTQNTKSCGCLQKVNIVGKKYGRLTVLNRDHGSHWLCECACGKRLVVYGGSLKSDNTKSCGCYKAEEALKNAKPQGNLSSLMADMPEAYYWIGFLMADGSIDFKNWRLKLVLAHRDQKQVERFARFIGCENLHVYRQSGRKCCEVSVQDKKVVPKIVEKFGFRSNKTENPCWISWVDDIDDIDIDLFWAFLIGFIDGDGSIGKQSGRNDCFIRIKIHGSWLNNLRVVNNRLEKITKISSGHPKINAAGYAQVCWANHEVLATLKRASKGLPVLERKWGLIDIPTKERSR